MKNIKLISLGILLSLAKPLAAVDGLPQLPPSRVEQLTQVVIAQGATLNATQEIVEQMPEQLNSVEAAIRSLDAVNKSQRVVIHHLQAAAKSGGITKEEAIQLASYWKHETEKYLNCFIVSCFVIAGLVSYISYNKFMDYRKNKQIKAEEAKKEALVKQTA
jgi:hypothetical protein